jgi:hypothetical protein
VSQPILLEQITGTRNNAAWPAPGETVDLPDAEAAKLCAAGRAVPVVEDRTEKAVAPKAETRRAATKKTAAPKGS